jgi:hypothetical protein
LYGGPQWYGPHIFNLPTTVEVYASDSTSASARVSRTEYQYDGAALVDTPSVPQHNAAFNPYAPVIPVCGWEDDPTDPDYYGWCDPWFDPRCDGYIEQVYICHDTSAYDPATNYRAA